MDWTVERYCCTFCFHTVNERDYDCHNAVYTYIYMYNCMVKSVYTQGPVNVATSFCEVKLVLGMSDRRLPFCEYISSPYSVYTDVVNH